MLNKSLEYVDMYNQLYPSPTRVPNQIKQITFQTTEDCNLACSYCYQICKSHKVMDFATAKKFIDYIMAERLTPGSTFSEENTKGIVFEFIGGEPFLTIDLIEQICDYFEEQILQYPDSSWIVNHAYSFSTNGTLYFTPKVQKYLQKYKEFVSLGITIDGCKELHDKCRLFKDTQTGSYDIAIKSALAELHNNLNISTKITLAPANVEYLSEGLINMISLGFNEIHVNCAFEEGWELKDAQIIYQQMCKVSEYLIKNNLQNKVYIAIFDADKYIPLDEDSQATNWCGVSNQIMFALNYKGDIYPCIRFMESSIGHEVEPFVIGDLDNGICGTEEQQKRFDLISSLTMGNMSPDKCLKCPIASGCAWCTGYCYQRGDIKHKTLFNCLTHKAQALGCKKFYYDTKDWANYDKINIPDEIALEIISPEEWNKFKERGE